MSVHQRLRRAACWAVGTDASTRSCALIRLGLGAILWSRWAGELLLFEDISPTGLALRVAFFASTSLMFVGLFARAATLGAGAVTLSMVYYFGIVLGHEPWTHHHTYLLAFATFLCGLTPCGRSYSIDRWRALRRAEQTGAPLPPERGNVWGLRLIALQLSTIYGFSAWDKSHGGFLSGDRLEQILMELYVGSPWPESAALHAALTVSAWATVLLEYALAFLLFAPVRRWLVIPGILLHGLFYVLLPVGTYTATMWCLYLAYFDPDAVHRALDRLQQGPAAEPVPGGRGGAAAPSR